MIDQIYFVRKDRGASSDSLNKVKVYAEHGHLFYQTIQLQGPYHGSILACEMDPLNNNDIESVYQENDIEEEWKDKIDIMFIIDESLTLFKVQIIRTVSEVLFKINLSDKYAIKYALENRVRDKPFIHIGISDRCISIFDKIYNIHTGYSWDFIYSGSDSSVDSALKVKSIQNMTFSHQQIALVENT